MKSISFSEAYTNLNSQYIDYFRQYTYDRPLLLTKESNEDLKFIQHALYSCIRYFAAHYEKFSALMPLSDQVLRILELCKGSEYIPGSYRTDFLITEENKIKIIEITCRFALNGFLSSGFVNNCALPYAIEHNLPFIDIHSAFFSDLELFFKYPEKVILLRDDPRNEGKYFKELMKLAGRETIILSAEELPHKASLLNSAACVSQLTHQDWFSLPDEIILSYINSLHVNDLRTILLVHDKRLFSVFGNPAFREEALGKADADRFATFLTPTYSKALHPELWESLKEDKDHWIIKPPVFGRGYGITAGMTVDNATWLDVLQNNSFDDVIFQPYVKQKRFSGSIGKEKRVQDYMVGTLLYFQDSYYGPGLIRASNNPVTNQGDDRKIACLTLATDDVSSLSDELEWLI